METAKTKERKRPAKGKLTGIAAGVILAAAIIALVIPSFGRQMRRASEKLNETCPLKVDEVTWLDSTAVEGATVFRYYMTCPDVRKHEMDSVGFGDNMEPTLVEKVKNEPSMKVFRDHDVTISYIYRDMEGVVFYEFDVTPDLYK